MSMIRRVLLCVLFLTLSAPVWAQEPEPVRIMWASPLVAHEIVPNRWFPRMELVWNALGFGLPNRWSTTDANRAHPWAAGVAIIPDAQSAQVLAAIDSIGGIHYVRQSAWTKTFSDLTAQQRTRINTFCTDIGIAQPESAEVLRDVFNRLVRTISLKTIEDIQATAEGDALPPLAPSSPMRFP